MSTRTDLKVRILSDSTQFFKGMHQTQRQFEAFANKMKSFGRTMTTRVALPLATAAGAAVKLGSDFQASMIKLQTQVGLSA